MMDYTKIVAKWNTLTGTTAQKLTQINTETVLTGVPIPAIFEPSRILNSCVAADIASLPAASINILILLLSGSTVDASQNTTIRLGFQTIFAGKPTTLSQLGALVAPYDNPTQLWLTANGYPERITNNDLVAAGGLT